MILVVVFEDSLVDDAEYLPSRCLESGQFTELCIIGSSFDERFRQLCQVAFAYGITIQNNTDDDSDAHREIGKILKCYGLPE